MEIFSVGGASGGVGARWMIIERLVSFPSISAAVQPRKKHLKYRREPKHLDRVAPDIVKSITRFVYKVIPKFLSTPFCQVE